MVNEEFTLYIFLNLLTNHPFFSEPDGEITKEKLTTWINEKIPENNLNPLTAIEIDNLLITCEQMEFINIKRYDKGSIITPTEKIRKNNIKSEPISISTKGKINSIDSISPEDFFDDPYAQMLLEKVRKYPETYEVTKYLPFFFRLASNLINNRYTDWHTKLMLSATLGYIILEEDVIPDYHPDGYVDDLFALSYSLYETKQHNSSHVIRNSWEYQEDIFSLIDTVYANTKKIIGDKSNLVLHKVGLKKFKNLEMINYDPGVFQTINVIRAEKSNLIKLLVRILKMAHANCAKSDIDAIMHLIQDSPDYDEIKKEVLSTGAPSIEPKPTWKTIIEYLKNPQKGN